MAITRLKRAERATMEAFGLSSKVEYYSAPGDTPEDAITALEQDGSAPGFWQQHPANPILRVSMFDAVGELGFDEAGNRLWEIGVTYTPFGNQVVPEREDREAEGFAAVEATSVWVDIPTPFVWRREIAVPGDGQINTSYEWVTDWKPIKHTFAVVRVTVTLSSAPDFIALYNETGKLHALPGTGEISIKLADGTFIEDPRLWLFETPVIRKISPNKWSASYEWRHDPGSDAIIPGEASVGHPGSAANDIIPIQGRYSFASYQVGHVLIPNPLGPPAPPIDAFYTYGMAHFRVSTGWSSLPGNPVSKL
jgi:hypothetical protein